VALVLWGDRVAETFVRGVSGGLCSIGMSGGWGSWNELLGWVGGFFFFVFFVCLLGWVGLFLFVACWLVCLLFPSFDFCVFLLWLGAFLFLFVSCFCGCFLGSVFWASVWGYWLIGVWLERVTVCEVGIGVVGVSGA